MDYLFIIELKKGKEKLQLRFGFEVEQPKPKVINRPEIVPAKATIERQGGNVYVSYPPNTIGERMPCVFCPAAQAESLSRVGKRGSQYRYLCTLVDHVFENAKNPSIPKNCPRKLD